MDYAVLRKKMVEEQIFSRGIRDKRILNAFYKVERHKFVPQDLQADAYSDFPLAIGQGQTISQPYIVALMTEQLGLTGIEKVLEIGTGSGFQTAILAELAREVYTIERIESLGKSAENLLMALGYANIKFRIGDGTLGWAQESPFDRIIITAASTEAPFPLIEQLSENGKLILPLGAIFNQILTLLEKKGDKFDYKDICNCMFVPLIGQYGLIKK